MNEGAAPQAEAEQDQAPRRPRYPTGFVAEEQAASETTVAAQPAPSQAAAPVAAPVAAAAPAPAPAVSTGRAGLPKVQSFELPLSQLQQVAEGSGLVWVNSDADKVAAVRAAIAAEPKPVHVPRERPPVVVVDEGPLVLVETRRDLADMKLPFENTNAG